MNIIDLVAEIYNTACAVFNHGIENYWNTIPSGSKWFMVALLVWLIYQWGARDGRRAVLKKLREREKHARKSA